MKGKYILKKALVIVTYQPRMYAVTGPEFYVSVRQLVVPQK